MRPNYQFLIILLLPLCMVSFAQNRTNFELIDSLIKESVEDISGNLKTNDTYSLNFIGSDEYSILNQRLREHFRESGFIVEQLEDSISRIDFTLIEARTDYPEIFKENIFGSYLIGRTSKITYSYSIVEGERRGMVYKNTHSISDTVLYSDLPQLENIAYSFTSSEVPDEPLFSSALEPAIAIGTAAVAVYLFFNIRSK